MRGRWMVVTGGAAAGIFAVASNPANHMTGQPITPSTPPTSRGTVVSYVVRQIASGPSREVSKMIAHADADPDIGNKQVLVDTFRNLVRYALLKTHRDVVKLGVTPSSFSVDLGAYPE
jgi:hypothetical protein